MDTALVPIGVVSAERVGEASVIGVGVMVGVNVSVGAARAVWVISTERVDMTRVSISSTVKVGVRSAELGPQALKSMMRMSIGGIRNIFVIFIGSPLICKL
jgi:carbamoylphosphate synthase large subunit